jgi:hypothetical protein
MKSKEEIDIKYIYEFLTSKNPLQYEEEQRTIRHINKRLKALFNVGFFNIRNIKIEVTDDN